MDRFTVLQAFVRVAETGGFAAAARSLGVSKPVISDRVRQLEDAIGQQLFHRTTRHVRLTETGQKVLPHYQNLVRQLDDLATMANDPSDALAGRLRIACLVDFGISHIAPCIPSFAVKNPSLEIELTIDNRVINPAADGFDIAIHFKKVRSRALRSVPLLDVVNGYYASPQYLVDNGHPLLPRDLARHRCIGYAHQPSVRDWNPRLWSVYGVDGVETVEVPLVATSNSGLILRGFALAGQGIAVLPVHRVRADIAAGTLVRVLPKHAPASIVLLAVFSAADAKSRKVRALIGHLKAQLELFGESEQ